VTVAANCCTTFTYFIVLSYSLSAVSTTSAVSAAPLRQTFEDWALQTGPSPTHLTGGPTSGNTTYLETAFEDWVEQQQMDSSQQPGDSTVLELGGPAVTENGNSIDGEDDIRWETVEGEAELQVELNDDEEKLDDGTTLRRQTVTRRRVCPVSDVLIINGVSAERRRGTDRLLDISIEEDVLVLPPGVDDPDFSDDLRTTTDVREVEESLEDGTPVYRRITTTTVVPAPRDLVPAQSDELELEPVDQQRIAEELDTGYDDITETVRSLESPAGFSTEPLADTGANHRVDSEMDIEKRAQQVVTQSVEAALQEVLKSTSQGRCLNRATLLLLVSFLFV